MAWALQEMIPIIDEAITSDRREKAKRFVSTKCAQMWREIVEYNNKLLTPTSGDFDPDA